MNWRRQEIADKNMELVRRDQELRVRMTDLQVQRSEADLQVSKLNSDLELRVKKYMWKHRGQLRDIQHCLADPFKDGVLTISDRRIALNGPIWQETADYIAERIDYFNNQNREHPIFIVIDSSPGGSVMAGYKILKAMEGSAAPVYVVVKSYAASMAANILTQSKKSFAYPNAVILHHQILNGSFGNLTVQKENVKEMEEWWKRLAAPVAAKMGISLDEFIKRMYENRSTGDWEEFGDNARKLQQGGTRSSRPSGKNLTTRILITSPRWAARFLPEMTVRPNCRNAWTPPAAATSCCRAWKRWIATTYTTRTTTTGSLRERLFYRLIRVNLSRLAGSVIETLWFRSPDAESGGYVRS